MNVQALPATPDAGDNSPGAATICAFLISVTAAGAQTNMSAPVNIVLQSFPITVAAGDYELISQVLDLPAGSGIPNHMHGGPVAVTVITGEVTLIEVGSERLVKSGES
jgi:quercetin dioxygenase-like cupin family protein